LVVYLRRELGFISDIESSADEYEAAEEAVEPYIRQRCIHAPQGVDGKESG
jgi:hypothetical protein